VSRPGAAVDDIVAAAPADDVVARRTRDRVVPVPPWINSIERTVIDERFSDRLPLSGSRMMSNPPRPSMSSI
jgi:hypothetical protein